MAERNADQKGQKTVGWVTFDQMNGKTSGSTRIRALNPIKYWPEAEVFVSGRKYDALIFQKAYWTPYAKLFDGVKIFDLCDPDWLDGSFNFREMIDVVDGLTCPTEEMAAFLKQFGKPIRVIPDRHDLESFKQNKQHKGRAKKALWFGFSHNFEPTMGRIRPYLEKYGLDLKIISNTKVSLAKNWQDREWERHEKYVEWNNNNLEKVNWEMLEADFAILPRSVRLYDKYKSDNKKTHAWLLGLPVVEKADQLERFMDEGERIKEGAEKREFARANFDTKLSVQEYKEFINDLWKAKR